MGPFRFIQTLRSQHELITTLATYDIRARYKQTVLGAGWAVFQPFVTMVVFTLIFSKFAQVPSGDIPYPVFSFSALVFWTFFATSLSKATLSLVANATLIRKIYLPREIFPVVTVLSAFFDFLVAFVILIGLMLWYGIWPTVTALWLIPLVLLEVFFVLALSFFTSMLHATYRDVGNAIGLLIQMWMFLSPVAYPLSIVPEQYRTIYMLNPMAVVIDSCRRVLVSGETPDLRTLGMGTLVVLGLFTLSYSYFKRREDTIVDVM